MTTEASPPRRASRSRVVGWVVGGIVVITAVWLWQEGHRHPSPPLTATPRHDDPPGVREFLALEEAARQADQTVWGPEILAQAYGARVDALWNALNAANDALTVLEDAPLDGLRVPEISPGPTLPHGIVRHATLPGATARAGDALSEWRARLASWRSQGWRLDQSEWRHLRFTPPTNGLAAQSHFEIHLHLSRLQPPARAQVATRVRFDWPQPPPSPPSDPPAVPERFGVVTVLDLEGLTREGNPAFVPAGQFEMAPFARTAWIDPLIAREREPSLPDGSVPELILAARNLVLRREAAGGWRVSPLTEHHPGLLFTAILADVTGDAHEDLLIAVRQGLVLLRGHRVDGFLHPAEPAWQAPERLEYAQAFTCGDIDGDGDLDVFLGQYRPPYVGGQMPRPYFNALDGPPAYLLRNRGDGRFDDVTAGSGLEPKRHRRSYGASFVDLDGDGDLDLLVTSDFAGADVHANDGTGRFTDRTADWLEDSHAFGMSHSVADFDADGRSDILLLGMPQPTADRLGALGLELPDHASWAPERSRVTVGNRLLFGHPDGRFRAHPRNAALTRTGWAWSAAVADLDLDGLPDLHIVNGHETRASVRDYEPEFWTHDIYLGDSTPRPGVDAYFAGKFARTRGQGWSYGGYDKNRLHLNLGEAGFLEVGHLFGVALEADSRNVLAEDLDGDGDPDLVVTTFEVWPQTRQTVRLFENTLPRQHHWIGFRLRAGDRGLPPVGATLTVRAGTRTFVRPWIVGDGYRSQSAPLLRVGLGEFNGPVDAEVRWAGGRTHRVTGLAANQVHTLSSPPR